MIATILGQILGFGGALCLLLFGMEMLSNGIQKGAGNSLQSLLGKISGNRLSALLTGIAVTAIIQSSGATTVMVVSFVNAEILSLTQGIGIIFGANIGTTVTAWIVSLFGFSFSIEAAAVPLFGFGFVLKYFKRFKIHNFADCFMGFAILFWGLGLLKASMDLKPDSVAFLQYFAELGLLGLVLGVLLGGVLYGADSFFVGDTCDYPDDGGKRLACVGSGCGDCSGKQHWLYGGCRHVELRGRRECPAHGGCACGLQRVRNGACALFLPAVSGSGRCDCSA